jgi:hypothetical protein
MLSPGVVVVLIIEALLLSCPVFFLVLKRHTKCPKMMEMTSNSAKKTWVKNIGASASCHKYIQARNLVIHGNFSCAHHLLLMSKIEL